MNVILALGAATIILALIGYIIWQERQEIPKDDESLETEDLYLEYLVRRALHGEDEK